MNRILINIVFLILSHYSLTQVEWGYNIGGNAWEKPLDIYTDQYNNTYIVGRYSGSIDFDPGTSILEDSTSNYDIFIQKISPGKDHLWTKLIKGTFLTQEISIVCDANYLYLTGDFNGTADLDPGQGVSEFQSSNYGDIMILKLTLGGNFVLPPIYWKQAQI